MSEALLDLAPCIFLSSGEDGIITHVNEKICKELGYTREELIGKKIDILFPIATKIFQQTHLFPLLKMQEHAEEIFFSLQKKNKEQVPVLVNSERRVVGDKVMFLYAGIIVYHRKQFEDELVAAKKAAEDALQKSSALMDAKAQLQKHVEDLDQQMYTVSKQNDEFLQFNRVLTHDLQEPLRKLLLFSGLLQESIDRETQLQAANKLVSVSEQMRTVISGLQRYVWLAEHILQPEEVNLNRLVKVVCEEVETAQDGKKFKLQIESLPTIQADKDQLKLLFYELFMNSIRFSKEDEELNIKITSNTLMLNRFLALKENYQYTEFFKIDITDNGKGFHPSYKKEVFQLFRRLHTNSGRGIGLALCKKIVDNHNGRIKIYSAENQGTTVSIFLPVKESVVIKQEPSQNFTMNQ